MSNIDETFYDESYFDTLIDSELDKYNESPAAGQIDNVFINREQSLELTEEDQFQFINDNFIMQIDENGNRMMKEIPIKK